MIALHTGRGPIGDSAKCATVSAETLPLKALRSESLLRRAESFAAPGDLCTAGTATKSPAAPEPFRSAESIRQFAIGISDPQPMSRIVSPDVSGPEAGVKVPESIPVKEIRIRDDSAAKPVRPPTPTETAP
jgi:hypothetical protein